MDRDLYTHLYNCGKFTLKDIFDLVVNNTIDKHDFHWITNLSYEGIKKSRGW